MCALIHVIYFQRLILGILCYNNVPFICEHKTYFPLLRKPFSHVHGLYCFPNSIFSITVGVYLIEKIWYMYIACLCYIVYGVVQIFHFIFLCLGSYSETKENKNQTGLKKFEPQHIQCTYEI